MIYFIIGAIVGHLTGLLTGLYLHWIKAKLNDIWNRDPEPAAQVVTPKAPGFADVNDFSSIVTPKTPDQIEREEQERVRNI